MRVCVRDRVCVWAASCRGSRRCILPGSASTSTSTSTSRRHKGLTKAVGRMPWTVGGVGPSVICWVLGVRTPRDPYNLLCTHE